MKLIDDSEPELPPLVGLGSPGPYRTPEAVQCLGMVLGSHKAPPQLRLLLAGGYELDVPVSPDAMLGLVQAVQGHGAK